MAPAPPKAEAFSVGIPRMWRVLSSSDWSEENTENTNHQSVKMKTDPGTRFAVGA